MTDSTDRDPADASAGESAGAGSIRVHLIGTPAHGEAEGDARMDSSASFLETLLDRLRERPWVRSSHSRDFEALPPLARECQLLISCPGAPRPDAVREKELLAWLETGGRWLDLRAGADDQGAAEGRRSELAAERECLEYGQRDSIPTPARPGRMRIEVVDAEHPLTGGLPPAFEMSAQPIELEPEDGSACQVLLTAALASRASSSAPSHPTLPAPGANGHEPRRAPRAVLAYTRNIGRGSVVVLGVGARVDATEVARRLLANALQWGLSVSFCRPLLPTLDALTPYLRRIDSSRWYSNFGPLSRQLEASLAQHFGVEPREVALVANGTLGLVLALQAQVARPGLCLLPSFTFVASAHAVRAAGLTPWFLDVSERDWALSPSSARRALDELGERVVAVMPVAPFGCPLDVEAWDRFHEETRLPVVIDGAAAFDTARAGKVPTMVSLHATKALGSGEGGLLLSRDVDLIRAIQERSNFGFFGSRRVSVAATNAKLSEYHAAVGLAALDEWPRRRRALEQVASHYARRLERELEVEFLPGFGGGWVSNTCTLRLRGRETEPLPARLAARGIEVRRWWGEGCHRQPAFAACGSAPLPVTATLAREVLSLPYYTDIPERDVERVVAALAIELAQTSAALPAR